MFLCFYQGALQPHFLRALPVIITASLCDTILISLSVLGVSVVVLQYYWLKIVLLAAGICFLLYMGFVTLRSTSPMDEQEKNASLSPKKQIVFAMSVSLLNPHAILDTVGVIGTSSLAYEGADKIAFAVSCIIVSWLWFAGLGTVGRLSGKLDKSGRFLILLNKVSAIVMWATALYIGSTLFMTL